MQCTTHFLSQQVNNPELPVRTGTLEEPNIRAMEIMDTNQLTNNIKGDYGIRSTHCQHTLEAGQHHAPRRKGISGQNTPVLGLALHTRSRDSPVTSHPQPPLPPKNRTFCQTKNTAPGLL